MSNDRQATITIAATVAGTLIGLILIEVIFPIRTTFFDYVIQYAVAMSLGIAAAHTSRLFGGVPDIFANTSNKNVRNHTSEKNSDGPNRI